MSYLKDLFNKYLLFEEDTCEVVSDENKKRFGEFCLGRGFLFLVTEARGEYAMGYAVTEWIDFATSDDFIFNFNNQKWAAITERYFWIKEDELKGIGIIDVEDSEDLYMFCNNMKNLPEEKVGLNIPCDDMEYVQNQFRERLMDRVEKHSNVKNS